MVGCHSLLKREVAKFFRKRFGVCRVFFRSFWAPRASYALDVGLPGFFLGFQVFFFPASRAFRVLNPKP